MTEEGKEKRTRGKATTREEKKRRKRRVHWSLCIMQL